MREWTACASDSKKFGAWDANLMTEWHVRYRGTRRDELLACGTQSVCIYQIKACLASEIAAMLEGMLRHCTSAEVDRTYVDTHARRWSGSVSPTCSAFSSYPA